MKKIFMASICAIMAVTAANADIASTTYVDNGLAKKENIDNKVSAITDGMQKDVMYPTVSLTEELIATSNQDMSDLIGDVADGKTVVEMISEGDAATSNALNEYKEIVNTELGKKVNIAQGDNAAKKLMNTDKSGKVVAGEIKKNTTDTTDGSFITGLSVDDSGNLVYTDGKVIDADIEDNAVTTAKIANTAVTTAKIADNAVTTAKIADKNVTKAKLSDEVQTSLGKADAALPAATLADAALNNEDGVYTLTMRKEGTAITYYWEKIGR